MRTVSETSVFSALANAAYINFNGISHDGTDIVREARRQNIIPTALAERLFRINPNLVNHQVWSIPDGGYYGNDGTGFAATLFEKDDEKVFAIRGTDTSGIDEFATDLIQADLIQIGFYGLALNQTVSMINYILKLSTPVDAIAPQFNVSLTSEAEATLVGFEIPLDDRSIFLNVEYVTVIKGSVTTENHSQLTNYNE